MAPRERPSCYDQAVRLLARRTHFRSEMVRKLRMRAYEDEDIDRALDRLEGQGYLSDAEAAKTFVAERANRGGVGRLRLEAELARRGASKKAIKDALKDFVERDDYGDAREEAESWARRRRRIDSAALGRHLRRRGFSMESITRVIEEEVWRVQRRTT